MKHQRGELTPLAIVLIGFLVFFVVVGIGLVSSLISVYNEANSIENRLESTWESNRVELTNYRKKVVEAAQVPEMYRNDLVKVAEAAIQGRYGADGSRATFQWIQEHNPNVDPSLYKKIQQIIEAGRDDFKGRQNSLVEIKRQYNTTLGSAIKGNVMHFMGFPRVDLNKYKIISDSATDNAFETGQDEAIRLNGK